jgi:hypothetical protein
MERDVCKGTRIEIGSENTKTGMSHPQPNPHNPPINYIIDLLIVGGRHYLISGRRLIGETAMLGDPQITRYHIHEDRSVVIAVVELCLHYH